MPGDVPVPGAVELALAGILSDGVPVGELVPAGGGEYTPVMPIVGSVLPGDPVVCVSFVAEVVVVEYVPLRGTLVFVNVSVEDGDVWEFDIGPVSVALVDGDGEVCEARPVDSGAVPTGVVEFDPGEVV